MRRGAQQGSPAPPIGRAARINTVEATSSSGRPRTRNHTPQNLHHQPCPACPSLPPRLAPCQAYAFGAKMVEACMGAMGGIYAYRGYKK